MLGGMQSSPPVPTSWRSARSSLRWLLELLYNDVVTHVPSHTLRQAWLRALGARIGEGSAVLRGTIVHSPRELVIGNRTNVGWRVVLDARGGIVIGDDCVISSDTQFITGTHDVDSEDFAAVFSPIVVGDHCWVATRTVVLGGVTMQRGAVAAAGALVCDDVAEAIVVAGIPARPVRRRESSLTYRLAHRPLYS